MGTPPFKMLLGRPNPVVRGALRGSVTIASYRPKLHYSRLSSSYPPKQPYRPFSQRSIEMSQETSINGTSKPTAWSGPGPAAFDFRSDVVTTPTPSMLLAIQNTTLLDDVFAEEWRVLDAGRCQKERCLGR